jgi:cytochrome c6
MKRDRLILTSGLLLLSAYQQGAAQMLPVAGRDIFRDKCRRCHGKNGSRGFAGAADLQRSLLDEKTLYAVISNGRGTMPAWKNKLGPGQIRQLVVYLRTLQSPSTK